MLCCFVLCCVLQSAIKLLFHFDANTKDSSAASDSSSAYGEHLSAEIGKFDLPNTHLVFFLLYYFIITCFCFGKAVENVFAYRGVLAALSVCVREDWNNTVCCCVGNGCGLARQVRRSLAGCSFPPC